MAVVEDSDNSGSSVLLSRIRLNFSEVILAKVVPVGAAMPSEGGMISSDYF